MTAGTPAATPPGDPDLAPKFCPRCQRPAHFRYTSPDEARRQTPLCWGETEDDCPGWRDSRDRRQAKVFAWAKAAFSVEQATSLRQRGLRLLEEAIETLQAVGGDPAQAHRLVDYVFGRPVGELGQELGGVSVCLLALAAAAGLSADAEEQREVERVLAKPLEEFAKRNAAKNAAGFLAQPIPRTDLAATPAPAAATPPPVCSTCNDTHRMTVGVPCTRCPVPCERCRSGPPPGPFCATTPCSCSCHAGGPR